MIPKKKKIGLFLASHPHGGGTFQYNLSILDAVACLPKDIYNTVIVYKHKDFYPFLKDHDVVSLYIRDLLGRAANRLIRLSKMPVEWHRAISPYVLSVARTIIKQKCDLWIFPSQESLAYEIPVPTLMVIFDLMHRYERRFPEVSANGEYERREAHYKNICRWAKGVLVDSELGKQQVVDSYGLNPEIIYALPTVPPEYLYSGQNQTDPGSRYGLPEKYFFYPAQFWEHKNHKSLIRAAAVLKPKYPDIHLVLAGSRKDAYTSAVELVQDLDLEENVHFLGYVPDAEMAELYRRARALLMPTFFGPTNIPPLEANALGCPAAVSDIYGMREQMGDAALYFNPGSVTEITQVMERLWRDDALCRDLAERGLVRVSQWTQAHFNERLRGIIDAVLLH